MKEFLDKLNWVVILGIVVAIETQIGNGSMSLTNMVPDSWIPFVKAWAANLGSIGALIMSAGAFGQRPQGQITITPPAVAKVLIIAFVLSLFLPVDPAQAQIKKPQVTGDIVADTKANFGVGQQSSSGFKATGNAVQDLLGALDAKLLPDLQYALALASASNSKVTAPCYQAWIAIIEQRQNAAKNSDGSAMTEPDPHIVTDFEKMVELRNALQPESDFMLKCSPVASMVKKDIAGFIGIVLAGGAGLVSLVPGL